MARYKIIYFLDEYAALHANSVHTFIYVFWNAWAKIGYKLF